QLSALDPCLYSNTSSAIMKILFVIALLVCVACAAPQFGGVQSRRGAFPNKFSFGNRYGYASRESHESRENLRTSTAIRPRVSPLVRSNAHAQVSLGGYGKKK
ncbi:unnamed protein product, partial [Meganyctiphanes norvegica]